MNEIFQMRSSDTPTIIVHESAGKSSWLFSLADLLGIVVTFLIIIFAMTLLPSDNKEPFLATVQQSYLYGGEASAARMMASTSSTAGQSQALGYLATLIENRFVEHDVPSQVHIDQYRGELRIVVPSDRKARAHLLETFGQILLLTNNEVSVEVVPNVAGVSDNRMFTHKKIWAASWQEGQAVTDKLLQNEVRARLRASPARMTSARLGLGVHLVVSADAAEETPDA